MRRSVGNLAGYIIGFGSLFAIWHLASIYLLNSILFPPPVRVIAKAIELTQDGTLWENASISLQRIAFGFFFGALIGIPLGLAIGSFGIVRRLLEPYTEFLRFIPATALITVAVIWFGIGEGSKIFLIIYTTVFIVIINTAAGVSAVAPNKIRAARSLGANPAQVFLFVALPATVPFILTGMRLAMANSFVTIIAAELVAANAGLGKMIWDARLYMLVDQIFVALLVLGLLGFTADRLFRWAIYAFAGRFSPVT
ncbi:MAG TPA: ABC transporter permease [Pyrinomonadaceae bacterium]|nr:ABC transporter permease [Pyrinomonadaceae bacterium]